MEVARAAQALARRVRRVTLGLLMAFKTDRILSFDISHLSFVNPRNP
jgi:hypothetical protein